MAELSAPRRTGASGGDIWGRESRAVAALLPGGRLHLQHGPIDIVAQAWGEAAAVRAGYARAAARFSTVLPELVAELPALRAEGVAVSGAIARRMAAAVAPFRPAFVTPMAAVAGAVAEEVLGALVGPGIERAQVNNGGDIALFLGPGQQLTCVLAATGDWVVLRDADMVRGIATSGWRGRSFSLGIADAVTVLARTAAQADAAATMVANAVNVPGHPGIVRRPARDLQADSDLGARLVTVNVPLLTVTERAAALAAGLAQAESFRSKGLIEGAALLLQGEMKLTGALALAGKGTEMTGFAIRKIVTQVEEILHEGGPLALPPPVKGAIYAICANPFAGCYEPDLQPAMETLKPLALQLTDRLVAALGGRAGIDAYGKGAIVGEAGEHEHGAIWHVSGGYGMRERLGQCRAIVPSAMKVGGMGTTLDIPLGHLNAAYVRSRFDVISLACEDGPRAGEVLFALAMARGGRVHSRMGGLELDQVKGEDGLR